MLSSLYIPYKAIGIVTDNIPFIINYLGDEGFIVVSIGKAFQVYRLDHLTSTLVSQQVPDIITSIQVNRHETFVSVGNIIYVYDRTKIVNQYNNHKSQIINMIMIGKILFSYDIDNTIHIIDTKLRKVISTLKLLQESQISFICHPTTYVNKIVIGFENGQLELWNVRKKALIHTFTSHISYFNKKNPNSNDIIPTITYIEQSPAPDVCAIGFSSGDILLINLLLDKILFTFKQGQQESSLNQKSFKTSTGNEVTSISFRTDSAAERFPYMVTGSGDGRIYIWHLGCPGQAEEPRRLLLSLDEAHEGRINKVQFLYGEPIMVTSAEDNTIKMWIFDSADGTPRLLRSREGHRGTSNRIRFYGGVTVTSMRDNTDGMSCEILSAGVDNTFRLFNFALEAQNRELSQKPILKKLGIQRRHEKLPTIIGFDFCETLQHDWSDVATIHKDSANTHLWRFKNRTISEKVLKQPNWKLHNMLHANVQSEVEKSRHSTAVCLSSCGNFCMVGTKGGQIYLYNTQSGLPRGSFPQDDSDNEQFAKLKNKIMPGNIFYDQKKILGIDGTEHTYRTGSLSNNNNNNSTTTATNTNTTTSSNEKLHQGHTSTVTGLFLNLSNTTLVSCGLDGLVLFWNFHTHRVEHSIQLSSPQSKMEAFRDGDLVCVVGQDRVMRLYDLASKKLCRRFDGKLGHQRAISDICFTPDGRRLLSASLDSTVRVWDLPTSRCLSWMKYPYPITSMCMSLSGEYLCLTFAGTEGIHMYIDRSLYETVHFWREPTEPTIVEECAVKSEASVLDLSKSIEDNNHNDNNNEDDNDIDNQPITISAVQAHVDINEDSQNQTNTKENIKQRGNGTITMAALPKAYWFTLFNLETIKERNKPIEPPTAPPLAPFFLPTVVKVGEGITPAFPTPLEYEKLVENSNNSSSNISSNNISSNSNSNNNISSNSNNSSNSGNKQEKSNEIKMKSSIMSSVWNDDDGKSDENENSDNDGNDDWNGDWNSNFPVDQIPELQEVDKKEDDGNNSKKRKLPVHQSRIIRRNVELPRSQLVVHINKQFPFGPNVSIDNQHEIASPITDYLKTITPSSIDVQFRSLYNGYDTDIVGLDLVHCMILWFVDELKKGDNYEVLEAYLTRFLLIYSELIIETIKINEIFQQNVTKLIQSHQQINHKFRNLIQSNLCILKMMAQISSI